jgi:hypothetical protein
MRKCNARKKAERRIIRRKRVLLSKAKKQKKLKKTK